MPDKDRERNGAPIAPDSLIGRLVAAQNERDLDTLVKLFAADYESEQPLDPGGNFVGSDTVREHWRVIFRLFKDFRVQVIRSMTDEAGAMAEFTWQASFRSDGRFRFNWPVCISLEENAGTVSRARLYMRGRFSFFLSVVRAKLLAAIRL